MTIPAPLQTALISAITAGVVTLLVEYAAKPHLEARKDRILEANRAKRAADASLDGIMSAGLRLVLAASQASNWSAAVEHLKILDERVADLSRHHAQARLAMPRRQRLLADKAVFAVSSVLPQMETVFFFQQDRHPESVFQQLIHTYHSQMRAAVGMVQHSYRWPRMIRWKPLYTRRIARFKADVDSLQASIYKPPEEPRPHPPS